MPALSKSLLVFGAGILTARASSRLRRKRGADSRQQKTFGGLAARLAEAGVWRAAGVEKAMTYRQFKDRLPLCGYEELSPAIERMKRGEPDVLWPGVCSLYAVSSGTTAGRTKYIPVTGEMLDHFEQTGLESLLAYTARVGHAGVFRGRHLFLGGATAMTPIPESKPFEAYAGDLSGIAAVNLPKWVERHFYEPGRAIAQMTDWPAKIEAITERTVRADISLIAGIPSWILILAEAVRAKATRGKARMPNLQAVWPNLECFIHGGVPLGPFQEEIRGALGPTVRFHEVYPASEAFIAVQDAEPGAGLRLMADAGVFFEFLPLTDFDETHLASLGGKAVPLAEVKIGVDYALILTTPAGLARYALGDVVRFTSTEPPRIVYVGRTKLQLSAFGEHVIEREITEALLAVCRRQEWTIVNFHVAPIFANSRTGQARGRHEWWVELRPGTRTTPTGPQMASELDTELKRLNDDYEAKRNGGGLEPPVVRLVMPGVFEHWMRHHGKWGGQGKMPRCRSDRQVADELAKIQHFAID